MSGGIYVDCQEILVDLYGGKAYNYRSIADIAGGKRCDGEIQLCAPFSGVFGREIWVRTERALRIQGPF